MQIKMHVHTSQHPSTHTRLLISSLWELMQKFKSCVRQRRQNEKDRIGLLSLACF